MRKIILGIIFLAMILAISGCDWQVNYNLTEQTDFLPESGADQYVMCNALSQAIGDLDFQKYAKQKVYLDVLGGTNYTLGVVRNLAVAKLQQVDARILERLSDDAKKNGLKEEPSDYQLELQILTCGIHSYDGIVRKHIMGLAMVGLAVTNKKNITLHYTGKLHRYRYEQWVFSSYFITALLALIVLSGLLLLRRLLRVDKKHKA